MKVCPYCYKPLLYNQFEKLWICDEHGEFNYYPKESNEQCIKCHICGQPARTCENIPIRLGNKYFCSWEHLGNYINAELTRMEAVGWI